MHNDQEFAISFRQLQESDFPILFKWLSAAHVKAWWDSDITWTPDLIGQKYSSYVQGFKTQDSTSKKIRAFVIYLNASPVGYIQIYNAYDFPRTYPLDALPASLAAFDMFIGEEFALRKGLGSAALRMFLDTFCKEDYVFADPAIENVAAIKTYKKAGFERLKNIDNKVWMLRKQ